MSNGIINKMDKLDESNSRDSFSRLNQEEAETMNRWFSSNQLKVIKKIPNRCKYSTRKFHRGILPNISRRVNTYPSQVVPEIFKVIP